MVNAPIWFDTIGLALAIRENKVLEGFEGEGDVSKTGDLGIGGFDKRKCSDGDAMVFFVIGEKGDEFVFVGGVSIEEGFVEIDHGFEL